MAGSFRDYSAEVSVDSASSRGASHEQGSVLQVVHVLFSSITFYQLKTDNNDLVQ